MNHQFGDWQQGPANVEISVDKDQNVVWLKLQAGEDAFEIGIPVDHAHMISQALAGACIELGFDPEKHSN